MMRKIAVALSALLVLTVFAPKLAAQDGQHSIGIEMLRAELDRTDQMIDRAKDAVQSLSNPQAALAIQLAEKLQQQAKDYFDKGIGYYKVSLNLTMQARDQVRIAMSVGGQIEQNDGAVQRRLEHAQELLDRASDAIQNNDNGSMQAIYDAAKDNLGRAWEFYRNKLYRPALKLVDQVENAAEKILSVGDGEGIRSEDFDRRTENVDRFLDQARDAIDGCNSTTASTLLDEAVKAFDMSRDLFDRGQVDAAFQALRQARTLAATAARACQGIDRLSQKYERLKAEADRTDDKVRALQGLNRDVAEKLVSQAYQQLDLAQGFIRTGDADKATAALQAAQLALRQAGSYIPQGG
jgi:hypothetical protein